MATRRAEIATRVGRTIFAAMTLVGFASANAASKLAMTVVPVFLGGSMDQGVVIDVDNTGQDARGTVTLDAGGGRTVYPVELPRGAHKRFIGYPLVSTQNRWEPMTCDLETDHGDVHLDLPPSPFDGNAAPVLEIGDEPGGLQFLSPGRGSGPTTAGSPGFAVYAKPENAPGRLAAYRSLAAVVLASGSERLSDAAVQALRQFVVSGGRVIFDGGADAQAFRDARWADVIPLAGLHTQTRTVNIKAGGFRFDQALDVQAGTPVPGAVTGAGGIVQRPIGLGLVVALPFDLLSGPMREWDGRTALMRNLTTAHTGAEFVWPEYTNPSQSYGSAGMMHGRYYYGTSTATRTGDNPFSYQPPAAIAIFVIMGCYLLIVAPVNFLVLRRLRRSELAWYSTPMISFVFAGVLLKLAAGLYAGSLRTMTTGTLAIAEGQPSGVFRGSSQIFFPAAGTVDLQLRGVDWLSGQSTNYYASADNRETLTALDVDQLIVPSLPVKNLQFKEFAYEQLVDSANWLLFAVARHGRRTTVTITNNSPFALHEGTLYVEGGQTAVASLDAGGRATFTVAGSPDEADEVAGWNGYSAAVHRPILVSRVSGFRPGPQVGSEVEGGYEPRQEYDTGSPYMSSVPMVNGIQLVAVGAESTAGAQ